MTDLKGLCQFIERDDGWVTLTPLQVGEILLAEARARLDLFLRQASFLSQASEVLPYQLAHIHAPMVGVRRRVCVSTIICKCDPSRTI